MGIKINSTRNYNEFLFIQEVVKTNKFKNEELIIEVLLKIDKVKLINNLVFLNKLNFIGYNAFNYRDRIMKLEKKKEIEIFIKYYSLEDIFNFEFIKQESIKDITRIFNFEKKSINLLIEKLYINIDIKPSISSLENIKNTFKCSQPKKYLSGYKNLIKFGDKTYSIKRFLFLFLKNKFSEKIEDYIKNNFSLELDIFKGYLANKIRNK